MVVDRAGGRSLTAGSASSPSCSTPRDILARNNTRVLPARLIGRRESTGGQVGGPVPAGPGRRGVGSPGDDPGPARSPASGSSSAVAFPSNSSRAGGRWVVRPLRQGDADRAASTVTLLERHGQTPLPPYIRQGEETAGDRTRYQTVYAHQPGSVAAPTAGLHFSEASSRSLAARGIAWADLTLHVGIGTFRPIEAEALDDHVMHAEWADLSPRTAAALNARRASGAGSSRSARPRHARSRRRPVGTSRALHGVDRPVHPPGHVFRGLDALITNFHLPRSSLLVLVSALAGVELIRAAYAEAIRRRYRFFSYGDAMLIL